MMVCACTCNQGWHTLSCDNKTTLLKKYVLRALVVIRPFFSRQAIIPPHLMWHFKPNVDRPFVKARPPRQIADSLVRPISRIPNPLFHNAMQKYLHVLISLTENLDQRALQTLPFSKDARLAIMKR